MLLNKTKTQNGWILTFQNTIAEEHEFKIQKRLHVFRHNLGDSLISNVKLNCHYVKKIMFWKPTCRYRVSHVIKDSNISIEIEVVVEASFGAAATYQLIVEIENKIKRL